MNLSKSIISAIMALAIIAPTAEAKKPTAPNRIEVELPTRADVTQRYGNLDYGIRIQVNSDVRVRDIVNLNDLPSKEAADFPKVDMPFSLTESVEQYLDSYSSGLGLSMARSSGTDFTLRVLIKDFRLRVRDYNRKKRVYSSSAAMVISYELISPENEVVISATTTTGRGSSRSGDEIAYPLIEAYEQALGDIDWDRIASQLKIAKTAKQEKNKEVSGMGDSALEHTVIRWYIVSKPQGADVSWRVVSSTPDVANTNANFVGSTPYESTEAFDIRGLSYNNSGNVQIEVTCEKDGYLPQKKRFNLRQAIDQKEISAKFNLVKEDTEEE
ncbi:MAG: hypothetical protein K2K82_03790 [Muribaculaceae bacterium]|nr:hypothetical protein [Muribaculaceae bacterium]